MNQPHAADTAPIQIHFHHAEPGVQVFEAVTTHSYTVRVKYVDGDFVASCQCPGFKYKGKCKHSMEAEKRERQRVNARMFEWFNG